MPVFVIGMPRSGTTLLSELMARHAGIVSRGELNFAEHIDRAVTGTPRQAWEDALTSSAAMYRTHIIRDDAAARVYIDKNPMNFLHLDWITAALPEARIIYCARHKADVALSLWFQFFESPATRFSHDFAWIREVDAGCEEIVSYWSARASILRVAYEDLVPDQTAVMARVLAHIGYDADVSAAEPMVQAGQIATSSLWQARQPVYASSIGRYRHYLEFIPELKSFL
ncbi:MAG: sulfotransferase [Pseudomonadota bacterium]|nr:sulfotransferase [Pseudomonadota bacterium]